MQSKPTNPPRRHHYIPEFYTKRWAGSDHRLTEFTPGYQGAVRSRRTFPGGTGYGIDLYRMDGFPDDLAQSIEKHFFSPVDSLAAKMLDLMETHGSRATYSLEQRWTWGRFLLSLLTRCPEDIDAFRSYWRERILIDDPMSDEDYDRFRTEADPPTYAEFVETYPKHLLEKSMFDTISDVIDSETIVPTIAKMSWTILTAPPGMTQLLTSDRPVIWKGDFGGPEGHLAIPIGPDRLFIAAQNQAFVDKLKRETHVEGLIRHCNKQVVEGAVRFVYGADDRQLRFVQNHFGKSLSLRPVHRVIEMQRAGTLPSQRKRPTA